MFRKLCSQWVVDDLRGQQNCINKKYKAWIPTMERGNLSRHPKRTPSVLGSSPGKNVSWRRKGNPWKRLGRILSGKGKKRRDTKTSFWVGTKQIGNFLYAINHEKHSVFPTTLFCFPNKCFCSMFLFADGEAPKKKKTMKSATVSTAPSETPSGADIFRTKASFVRNTCLQIKAQYLCQNFKDPRGGLHILGPPYLLPISRSWELSYGSPFVPPALRAGITEGTLTNSTTFGHISEDLPQFFSREAKFSESCPFYFPPLLLFTFVLVGRFGGGGGLQFKCLRVDGGGVVRFLVVGLFWGLNFSNFLFFGLYIEARLQVNQFFSSLIFFIPPRNTYFSFLESSRWEWFPFCPTPPPPPRVVSLVLPFPSDSPWSLRSTRSFGGGLQVSGAGHLKASFGLSTAL